MFPPSFVMWPVYLSWLSLESNQKSKTQSQFVAMHRRGWFWRWGPTSFHRPMGRNRSRQREAASGLHRVQTNVPLRNFCTFLSGSSCHQLSLNFSKSLIGSLPESGLSRGPRNILPGAKPSASVSPIAKSMVLSLAFTSFDLSLPSETFETMLHFFLKPFLHGNPCFYDTDTAPPDFLCWFSFGYPFLMLLFSNLLSAVLFSSSHWLFLIRLIHSYGLNFLCVNPPKNDIFPEL